jgi:FAD/FMN-containing dehydrogenase
MTHSAHEEKVRALARAVRERRSNRRGFASLDKRHVSHFVPDPRDPRHDDKKISIRDLSALLSIDPVARRAVAEPGLAFCDLVAATLAHGLVPKLVPELKTITVGGAVAGCSVESMSYVYGGFHDSCVEYEVVTGTGEVVTCSRTDEPLLFEMIHGSYGTLGILTKLEFELVPAKPFVRTEYRRFSSFAAFYAEMEARMAARDFAFIDGIAHAKDAWVLCLGNFVDHAASPSDYTRLEIFYKSTLAKKSDELKTADYFFRYDTECHWLTRTLPGMETKPMRFLLGRWLLGSTQILTWAKRVRPLLRLDRHPDVVVDVFIPSDRGAEFVAWYERAVDFFPLWIVPYRVPGGRYPWVDDAHAAKATTGLFLDFAVYGKRNNVPGVDVHALLEEKTFELGGIKTLISRNGYDESHFWTIYHRANYRKVKERVDPDDLFRNVFTKMCAGRR